MKTKVKENQKGITLIALVITIIVLLILASVSIAMLTGDNGILTRAGDAKIETAVGAVKEQVRLYQIEKKMNEQEVTAESLLAEGKVSRTVQAGEADKYYMYYALKENSFEGMQGLGKGNIASLKDVFLIDDNLNVKYISTNGKEYGDNLNNKVLDDETKIRFSSKAFSEYVSKISGVTEDEMKFKWMKNQTSLTIADSNVDSLQDLAFFPNLTYLCLDKLILDNLNGIENCNKLNNFISYSKIKDFDKLSKNENLEHFQQKGNCDFDNVIDSLKKLEKLKSVSIIQSSITNMKRIEELTSNIYTLSLGVNQITKIEGLENKTNLTTLVLNQNKITSMKGLENCINLKSLNLYNNNINKIESISKLTKLSDLNLGANHIGEILPLSENENLMSINLLYNKELNADRGKYTNEEIIKLNKIENIMDKGGTIYLDTDKLKLFTKYKKLSLADQNLTTLKPLEGLTELTYLMLMRNNITLEDEKSQDILSKMGELKYLCLNYNNLSNITAINKLTKLENLELAYTNANLAQIEDIISNLINLRVSNNELESIINCDINKIKNLNLQYSSLSKIPNLSKFTSLRNLNLSYIPNISNLENTSEISSLQILNLENDNLHGKMIDFSKLKNLTNLNLSNNYLWTEDLENLKALKNNTNLTINLSKNSIIDATPLLELNSNTKIDLRNNVNLAQDSKDKLKAKFGSNVRF